jgi:two-component system LytT family response regulator
LLFLDVQMPGCSGFDLLERQPRTPLVVFTTAYDAHALKAFEVNALECLMKPIDPRRLAAALDRVRAQMRPAPAPPLDRVFARDGDRCWLVRCRDLILLESEGNYTWVYFASERPLVQRSLQSLEERLDTARFFFRARRKHHFRTK